MSKTHEKPALSAEQQAAIAAIRERARKERPGPDELIDRGELDELVSPGQYIELRTLAVRLRALRERMGFSLTDVSERTGLTRAAISRLENGWNQNPTLETLLSLRRGARCRFEVHGCRVRRGWKRGLTQATDRLADDCACQDTRLSGVRNSQYRACLAGLEKEAASARPWLAAKFAHPVSQRESANIEIRTWSTS